MITLTAQQRLEDADDDIWCWLIVPPTTPAGWRKVRQKIRARIEYAQGLPVAYEAPWIGLKHTIIQGARIAEKERT